eukprot:8034285-Alexandrium_andersonii.AAC.1
MQTAKRVRKCRKLLEGARSCLALLKRPSGDPTSSWTSQAWCLAIACGIRARLEPHIGGRVRARVSKR